MIKHLFPVLFILSSYVSFGDTVWRDGCMENGKYKNEYTIDRRCYVPDNQKQTLPYNATVALLNDKNEIYCTGTIFRDNQYFSLNQAFQYETKLPVPGLYVYTAAHCVKNKSDTLKIRLQNGKEIITEKINIGSKPFGIFNTGNDWAVYKIPDDEQDELPFVDIAYSADTNSQLNVIGYGALAIMSDSEIKNYKKEYINFLENKLNEILNNKDLLLEYECGNKDNNLYYDECKSHLEQEVSEFGVSITSAGYELDNLKRNKDKARYFFNDSNDIRISNKMFEAFTEKQPVPVNIDLLKESVCHINGNKDFCQTYNGNSGGGVFVGDKLIGIVSISTGGIGENMHLRFLKDNDFLQAESQEGAFFLQNSQTGNLERMRKPIKQTSK